MHNGEKESDHSGYSESVIKISRMSNYILRNVFSYTHKSI